MLVAVRSCNILRALAMSRQKGPGYDRLAPNAFRVSREKCRLCPRPPRRLARLRTWPSGRLTFKPSELRDVSPRSRGKLAAPRAPLLGTSSQAVGRALPAAGRLSLHRPRAGTAGRDTGWGGRNPPLGAEDIPCRPTHLFGIKSTSSPATDPNGGVWSLLKPSYFAKTSVAQEKTWFLQRTKQGPKRD